MSIDECSHIIIEKLISDAANHCCRPQQPRCLANHIIPVTTNDDDYYEYNCDDEKGNIDNETRRICDGPCGGVKPHGVPMHRCRLCKFSMCTTCYDSEDCRIRIRINKKEFARYYDLFAEAPNEGITANEFASVARFAILMAYKNSESTVYQVGDVVRVRMIADSEARALQGEVGWEDSHQYLQRHRITVTDTTSRGNLDLVRANGLDWCPDMLEHCTGEDAIEGRRLKVGDKVVLGPGARFFPKKLFDGCLEFGRVGVVADVTDDWLVSDSFTVPLHAKYVYIARSLLRLLHARLSDLLE